jgi:hypothetical protein
MRTVIVTATIDKDAALSDAIHLHGGLVQELQMPAEWTAASLTFQTSLDGETFQDLYDSQNAEVSKNVEVARNYQLPLGDQAVFEYLKIRSGTSETPVEQAATRTIQLLVVGD